MGYVYREINLLKYMIWTRDGVFPPLFGKVFNQENSSASSTSKWRVKVTKRHNFLERTHHLRNPTRQ